MTPLLLSSCFSTCVASAQDYVEGDVPVYDAPDEPASDEAPKDGDAAPSEDAGEGAEGEEDLGEERADRPAPKGKGVVWGVLTDTKLGEPLPEAQVTVVGTKYKTIADFDGRFRLELPPGTYNLRFYYELHEPARFNGVEVAAGELVKLDAKLSPQEDAVDTIEVETDANRATIEGEILARQRSAAMGDSVGRVEIARTPDRNAAQAAQRVVGATVVGNRFVYVRGLGERYTNATLNGAPLPSPEPDRAAVPLDLFPTAVLNSLTIAKTFTPDMQADFAGGSVRIATREIPGELLFQPSLTIGYNTNSTFRERLSYRGGNLDWLGLDDGTRALPDNFPKYRLDDSATKPGGGEITPAELTRAGRALNSYMSSTESGTLPDHGGNVVIGNRWDLGQNRRLGVLGSLSYGRSYLIRRDEIRNQFEADANDPRGFSESRAYRGTTGSENVSWGAFGSLSYELSRHHQLTLLGIRTTLTDNYAQVYRGRHAGRDQEIHNTRLAFVTRALNMGQLSGAHEFPALGDGKLDWYGTLSRATRDEPNTRDTVWGLGTGDNPVYRLTNAEESGRHFFSEQGETQVGGGLDWTQPIEKKHDSKLKFGGLVSVRNRNFESRRLTLRVNPRQNQNPALSCPNGDLNACTDALFRDVNINNEGGALGLTEATAPTDAYDAELDVYAAYVMADLALGSDFRVILGERIEHTLQTIQPYDQFNSGETTPPGAEINEVDWLPVVGLVWNTSEKSKLRASVTRTLARPQLRELAPFAFNEFFGGRPVSGEPELEMTRITNVDLRFEYFPTLREVVASTLFFKDFRDPIETVVVDRGDAGGLLTYRNAAGARLIGVELEARKNLEFLTPALRPVSVVTNLTLAHSRIQLEKEGVLTLTNRSRPLVNQAPFVYNLAFDYANDESGTSARVLYNIVGPRIAEVGTKGLEDAYEHPRNMLDVTLQQTFAKSWQVKLAVKNLLNSPVLITQGCGKDGLFGSTWHLSCRSEDDTIQRRYTEGATFSLTAGYIH